MKKILLLTSAILLIVQSTFGQLYPYYSTPLESPQNGAPLNIYLAGGQPALSRTTSNNLNPQGATSIPMVQLQVDMMFNDAYLKTDLPSEVQARLSIKGVYFDNSTVDFGEHEISIFYDNSPTAQAHARFSSIKIQDPELKSFTYTLEELIVDGNPETTLPKFIKFEQKLLVEKYEPLNTSAIAFDAPILSDEDCDFQDETYRISWSSAATFNAVEYQLEWTYVDDYNPTGGAILPANLSYDFRGNSTRISTSETHYDLELLFDRGYVVYRVRAIGVNPQNPTEFVYGSWNLTDNGSISQAIGNGQAIYVDANLVHEPNLNWSYEANYAEDGKKKEMINYMDGSLRSRQVSTKLNTDQLTITGETIYDYHGRPVINTVPSPSFRSCASNQYSSTLKYYENYSQNTSGDPYSYEDFDTDAGNCDPSTGAMSTGSGASQYFSSANADQQGIQSYLPDAQKYPFTQIKYTSDNTGRPVKTGGVGTDFNLNSDHAVEYIYGSPSQVELDRLFGSEVGEKSKYRKHVVVDANGQVSVSFLDQKDRVIATALSGAAPAGLEQLDSYAGGTTIRSDELGSNNQHNVITADQNGYTISRPIAIEGPTDFSVFYDLNIGGFIDACDMNVCYECHYDLEIKLYDQCGDNLLFIVVDDVVSGDALDQLVGNVVDINGEEYFQTLNCANPTSAQFELRTNGPIDKGTYTLIKRLTINEDSRNEYIQSKLDPTTNSCLMTLDDFVQEELSLIDTTECTYTCESCLDELGSLAEYLQKGFGNEFEYLEELEDCKSLCREDYDVLDHARFLQATMMVDMSPGGQYAQIRDDNGNLDPSVHPLSIFNEFNQLPKINQSFPFSTNIGQSRFQWRFPIYRKSKGVFDYKYYNEYGSLSKIIVDNSTGVWLPEINIAQPHHDANSGQYFIYPQELKHANDFYEVFWNPNWSKSLIPYHPEYAYYIALEQFNSDLGSKNISSVDFDNLLINTRTFQQAVQNGLINSNFYTAPTSSVLTNWFDANGTHTYDPFGAFNSFYFVSKDYSQILQDRFHNYITIGGQTFSIVEFAAYSARGDVFTDEIYSNEIAFGKGNDQQIRDKEWNFLVKFYLSLKQEVVYERLTDLALSGISDGNTFYFEGYNGCIGEESFNPMSNPMINPTQVWQSIGSPTFSFITGIANQNYLDPKQPCKCLQFQYYSEKVRRFENPSEGKDESAQNSFAQHYAQTGQCPELFGIQQVLNELIQNGDLLNQNVPLQDLISFGQLYQYRNNMQYNGAPPALFHSGAVTSSGNGEKLTITWTGNNFGGNISLELERVQPSTSWASVTQIANLKVSSNPQSNYIACDAKGINTTNSNSFYACGGQVISGQFSYELRGCQFPAQTESNQLIKDLEELMNFISYNSSLHSTNSISPYNPVINSTVDDLPLRASFAGILGTSSNVIWKSNNSENRFEIYSTNNTSKKILIEYNPNSWQNSFNTGTFEQITSDGNNGFEQLLKSYPTPSQEYQLKGYLYFQNGGTTTELSTGRIIDPRDQCQGKEYDRFEWLKQAFDEVISSGAPLSFCNKPSYHGSLSALMAQGGNPTCKPTLIQTFYDGVTATTKITFSTDSCSIVLSILNHNENHYVADKLVEVVTFDVVDQSSNPTGSSQIRGFLRYSISGNLQTVPYTLDLSCFKVKQCESCENTALPRLVNQNTTDSSYLHFAYEAYKDYKQNVDGLNSHLGLQEGDPNFLPIASFADFYFSGGYIGVTTGTEISKRTVVNPDSSLFRRFDRIGVDLFEQTRGTQLYDLYQQAVSDYNDGVVASFTTTGDATFLGYRADTMSFDLFFEQHYADSAIKYINYLYGLDSSTYHTIQPIEQYITPPTFSALEDSLYSIYFNATKGYILSGVNNCRLPEIATLSDLVSRNTFCSQLALDNFQLYLDQISNNESCLTYLDRYSDCVGQITVDFSQRLMSEYTFLIKTVESSTTPVIGDNPVVGGVYDTLEYTIPSFASVIVRPFSPCDYALPNDDAVVALLGTGQNLVKQAVSPVDEELDKIYPIRLATYVSDAYNTIGSANALGTYASLRSYNRYNYPCDTIFVEKESPCEEQEEEFGYCLADLLEYFVSKFPNANQNEIARAETTFKNTADLCACADGFCKVVFEIINNQILFNGPISSAIQSYGNYIESKVECPNFIPCHNSEDTLQHSADTSVVSKNMCVEFKIAQAKYTAQIRYENYLSEIYNTSFEAYTNHCLGVVENMESEYGISQHHFMLYYYDQAGNLIKTVPPEGVDPLPITSSSDPLSIQINDDRTLNQKTVFTNHRMQTRYEYNSLNQLVYQSNPDEDPMDIFELTRPDGLPYNLTTRKIQMIDEKIGYLSGEIVNFNQVPEKRRGVLFKTINGGLNWDRVEDIIASDMNAVKMLTDQHGVAVGDFGVILRTDDGSSSWDVVDSYHSSQMINRLLDVEIFSPSGQTNYCFAGENLTYFESNDLSLFNVLDLSSLGNSATDHVVDIHIDPSTNQIFIIIDHLENGQVRSKLYQKTFGAASFTPIGTYRTHGLKGVIVQNNQYYIYGEDGQLYSGEYVPYSLGANTERYLLQTTGLKYDIKSLARTQNGEFAAVAQVGNDPLILTSNDEGKSWIQLNTSKYLTLSNSNSQVVIAGGPNGLLTMIPERASGPVIHANYTNLNPTYANKEITQTWIEPNTTVSDEFLVLFTAGNKLSYTLNGNTTLPVWVDLTLGQIASNEFVKNLKVKHTNIAGQDEILDGTYQASNNKLYAFRINLTTGQLSEYIVSNVAMYSFDLDPSQNTILAIGAASPYRIYYGSRFCLSLNGPVNQNLGLAATNQNAGGLFSLRMMSNSEVILTDNQGNVRRAQASGLYFCGTLYNFLWNSVDNKKNFLPEDLTRIESNPNLGKKTLVGADGQLYVQENVNDFVKVDTRITRSIDHIVERNLEHYLAGENGLILKSTIDVTTQSPELAQSQNLFLTTGIDAENTYNEDVNGLMKSANELYVGYRDGSYLHLDFSQSTLPQEYSVASGSINGFGLLPIKRTIVSVGNYSNIFEINRAYQTARKRIYPKPIMDLDFSALDNGVILAGRYFVRTYSGTSNRWGVVVPDLQVATTASPNEPFNKCLASKVNPSTYYLLGRESRTVSSGVASINSMLIPGGNFDQGTALVEKSNGNVVFAVLNSSTNQAGLREYISGVVSNIPTQSTARINDFHLFDNDSYVMVQSDGAYEYFNQLNASIYSDNMGYPGVPLAVDFFDNSYGVVVGTNGLYAKTDIQNINIDPSGYLTSISFSIDKPQVYQNPTEISTISNATDVTYHSVSIVEPKYVLIGGQYTPEHNRQFNEPSANFRVFDPNSRFSSRFYYDHLSRVVVSQNSRQYGDGQSVKYSYTTYDNLGRNVQAGEKTENSNGNEFASVFGTFIEGQYMPVTIDEQKLTNWIEESTGERTEVVVSSYDNSNLPPLQMPSNYSQDPSKTRNRIVDARYFDVFTGDFSLYDHATFYEYDIHGNATKVIQDNRKIAFDNQGTPTVLAPNRFKRTEYSFDLISGNVHRVSYQPGEVDQWHHSYVYDADNRVIQAYTSDEPPLISANYWPSIMEDELYLNNNWQMEVNYEFYKHGPLARVEIGNEQLQGLDYVYNNQGWLKGINSTRLGPTNDPGKDGDLAGNNVFAKDLYGYNLQYFQGDYSAINSPLNATQNSFHGGYTGSDLEEFSHDLFNGNIRSIQLTLTDINNANPIYQGNAYKYDQLQRLREARSFNNFNEASNSWGNSPLYDNMYYNEFKFDANGNIESQIRHNSVGAKIDSLTYRYFEENGFKVHNRLYYVDDEVVDGLFDDDINDMDPTNPNDITDDNIYVYDRQGRLIQDKSEGLFIEWRNDNKVKVIVDVDQTNPDFPTVESIYFDYDFAGNRIAKRTYNDASELIKSTYYVLDGSGNVMGIYEHNEESNVTTYKNTERYIYGASRIGMQQISIDVLNGVSPNGGSEDPTYSGTKQYELTNHQGNVVSVFRDIKNKEGDLLFNFTAFSVPQVMISDYSPYGVVLDGKSQSNDTYRFGFQNQEIDDEIKGKGNSINYKYRMHDPRIGRFFAIDPLCPKYPWYSPYQFSGNKVISKIELEGLEESEPNMSSRHDFTKMNFYKGVENNSYLLEGISKDQLQTLYKEALTLDVKDGNVKLNNGQTWYIQQSTGKFHPVSGNGIVNLTQQEVSYFRTLVKQVTKGGLSREDALANMSTAMEKQNYKLSSGMRKALSQYGNMRNISNNLVMSTFAKFGSETTNVSSELKSAANETFKGKSFNYVKWGTRTLVLVAITADVIEVYNAENKLETITKKSYGWAGATAGVWATGVLVAGQAGPQAAAPEEIITVPIAYLLGGISGYIIGETTYETIKKWVFDPLME